MSDDLPHRPRLNENAMLRRHRIEGEDKLILHDRLREEAVELDDMQLAQLLACDGTRDLGGVMLEAARQGRFRTGSAIVALLREIQGRGLLSDGINAKTFEAPRTARPFEALEGYTLSCDGNGSCCETYASVPFTRREAQRALGAAPEDERMFLPLFGAGDDSLQAVAMIDGACAFLGADRRCRLHAAGGADAKPRGCRAFPATYVDDGEAVRVSVAVECACVLSSLERQPSPATEANAESDLSEGDRSEGIRVVRLPEHVLLAEGIATDRATLRRWSIGLAPHLSAVADGVAAFWALADVASDRGLDVDASIEALGAAPPSAAALEGHLQALAAATAAKRASSWRGRRDRVTRLAAWLDQAAQALLDGSTLAQRLAAGPGRLRSHEAFHLRAAIHGHTLVGEAPMCESLRDRAIRHLLARQAAQIEVDDSSAGFPLTAVEAMMRGQGLEGYARTV